MEWGSFGDLSFRFGNTPKVVRRTNRYRYIPHNVINTYPHFGYMGEDVERIELQIELSYLFEDVARAIDRLKEMAKQGKPYRLMIGKMNTGMWVIEEIDRTYEETDREGKLLKAVVTLKLLKVK